MGETVFCDGGGSGGRWNGGAGTGEERGGDAGKDIEDDLRAPSAAKSTSCPALIEEKGKEEEKKSDAPAH